MKRLAADFTFAPPDGFSGPGGGAFENPGADPAGNFETLITTIIGVMTVVAGIWFIFVLFIGAIGWITAGGDKGAVETARKRISSGITGLTVVVIAIFLASMVGQFLGFDILNLAEMINGLAPQ